MHGEVVHDTCWVCQNSYNNCIEIGDKDLRKFNFRWIIKFGAVSNFRFSQFRVVEDEIKGSDH